MPFTTDNSIHVSLSEDTKLGQNCPLIGEEPGQGTVLNLRDSERKEREGEETTEAIWGRKHARGSSTARGTGGLAASMCSPLFALNTPTGVTELTTSHTP